MPKGSAQHTAARREEILSACAQLYQTMSFRDITIKEIGAVTSFTRTSIYNYFQTKEEIFLALLQQEYERWTDDLDALATAHDALSADELAQALAHTLERRVLLLKLVSMTLYEMEANSRIERLVSFKAAYGASIHAVLRLLEKFRPSLCEKERLDFVYAFFPFLFGVYPYTTVSDQQRQAMEQAGVAFVYQSVYSLTYTCARKLLTATHHNL